MRISFLQVSFDNVILDNFYLISAIFGSRFRPIHSTIQIWTGFHENEAKKIFFFEEKNSKWPFFKIANSRDFFAKISQIRPWVCRID